MVECPRKILAVISVVIVSTPTVTTVANVVGARNTTVTSSEHGKTVTVPVSNNAPVVPPRNPPPTQNSLPMLLQLLSQASRNIVSRRPTLKRGSGAARLHEILLQSQMLATSRSPLVPVNIPVKPTLSFNVKNIQPQSKRNRQKIRFITRI